MYFFHFFNYGTDKKTDAFRLKAEINMTFDETVERACSTIICNPANRHTLASKIMAVCNNDEQAARMILLEWLTDYMCRADLRHALRRLNKGHVLWHHPDLDAVRIGIYEQDKFIESPPEVDEGVISCKKCGSNRTFSYSKQTRRGDEATTVFVKCSKCQTCWRI